MVHQGSSFTVEEESGKKILFLLCFFVFVADLLQSILNQAKDRGLLDLPLPNGAETDFPIVQYADDTLLVLEACPKQLFVLKALLNSFANLTALKVNYTKSNIYPINVSDEKMEILSRAFNCQIGRYPFPYLGLPLGLTKPKVDDFLPIVNRIEKRLTSTSMLLNQAGKLEMVNSVLTALPTFYMCTLKLPPTVVKQIDKYRKHRLWWGADLNEKKSSCSLEQGH
jgi:hypothetical protein